MPEELASRYTFRIDIEGAEALKAAKRIRAEIRKELEGLAADQKILAKAYQETNAAITSQTRRWSYHKQRIAEVQEQVVSLNKALIAQITLLSTLGQDAFDPLVQSARRAYDQIIGHSIIPELSRRTLEYLAELRRAEREAFDPLTEAASEAGVSVDDLIGRFQQLQHYMRSMVEAEGSDLLLLLDKFVALSEVEPLIMAPPAGAPGGPEEWMGGIYRPALREIRIAMAALREEEIDFLTVNELLFTSLHETGHAFQDLAGRIAPVEAQLARAEYAVVAAKEIRRIAERLEIPFADALSDAFASSFARGFMALEDDPAFNAILRNLCHEIGQKLRTYSQDMWQALLEEPQAPGVFFQRALPAPTTTALVPTTPLFRGVLGPGWEKEWAGREWSEIAQEAYNYGMSYTISSMIDGAEDTLAALQRTGVFVPPTVYRMDVAQVWLNRLINEATLDPGKFVPSLPTPKEDWGWQGGGAWQLPEQLAEFYPEAYKARALDFLELMRTIREQGMGVQEAYENLHAFLTGADFPGLLEDYPGVTTVPTFPVPGGPPIALPPPKPPQWFLDLASGEPDARRWDVDFMPPGARAVAVDIDVSLSPDVVADALALPFKEHIFNEIYIGRLLSYVAEKEFPRLAEEVARVAAGKIEVADYADIVEGFRFPTFVNAILRRGFELVGDEAIDYVEDIAEMLAAGWTAEGLMDPGAGFRRLLEFQRIQPQFQLIGAPGPTPFQLAGLDPTALVPQLERINDLIVYTKEIAPGVYEPIGVGMDETTERGRILNGVLQEMVENFEKARTSYLAGRGEYEAGRPLLTAGAGGAGIGGEPPIDILGGLGYFEPMATRGEKATRSWTDSLNQFTMQLNKATLEFFGIRRVGYAFEHMGRQIERSGKGIVDTLMEGMFSYQEFNEAATRAGAAMEMQIELQEVLENAILDTSIALGLFDPREVAEGLRVWAAGQGLVIRNEADLQKAIAQTTELQMLAAMNNEQLGDVMRYTGGIMAEFDMDIENTSRVASVLNYVAAKTFAEVSDVGEAFAYVGPLAHSMGIDFEEAAAALALLSDENIKGSRAGRAMQQILRSLLDPTNEMDEAMQAAFASTKDWRDLIFPGGEFVGYAELIDYLAAATEDYTRAEKNQFLAQITTANATASLVSLVNMQAAARERNINVIRAYEKLMMGVHDAETRAYAELVEAISGVPFSMESAQSLMTQMTDRYMASDAVKVAQMQQRWATAMIIIGRSAQEMITPVLTDIADVTLQLAELLEKHPGIGKALLATGAIMVAIGTLSQVIGALMGIAANILIFRMATEGFGISTGAFGAAVNRFAIAMRLGPAAAGAGAAGAGAQAVGVGLAARIGLPAFLAWMLTWGPRVHEALKGYSKEAIDAFLEDFATAGAGVDAFGAHTEEGERVLEQMGLAGNDLINTVDRLDQAMDILGFGVEAAGAALSRVPDMVTWAEWAPPPEERWMKGIPPSLAPVLGGWQEFIEGALPGVVQLEPGITGEQREALERWDEYLDDRNELVDRYDDRLEKLQDRHQKAAGKALDTYLRSREDAIEDYAFRELRIEEDHQRSLANIREQYEQNVARIHERYAESIGKGEEQRQERIERYLEDYHKRMERMRLDHIWRMEDLIRERDARGALLEMRSHRRKVREAREDRDDWMRRQKEDYEKQRKEAAEARDKALAKAKEDFEKRLKEQQAEFERQRERREEDFERRLTEMEENYERQAAEREQQYEDDKQALKDAKAEELEELAIAAGKELEELLGYLDDEEQAYLDSYEQRLEDLEKFLDDYRKKIEDMEPIGPPPWRGPDGWVKQHGGYAFGGLYRVGEAGREFILDYPTTRALESFVGPLSQSRILGAFAGAGQGGVGLRIDVNQAYWTFQGSFTEEEKLQIQESTRQAAWEAVDEVAREILGA